MKWRYQSQTIRGNFHAATLAIEPEWDVVAMDYYPGIDATVVVYRIPFDAEARSTTSTTDSEPENDA